MTNIILINCIICLLSSSFLDELIKFLIDFIKFYSNLTLKYHFFDMLKWLTIFFFSQTNSDKNETAIFFQYF